MSSLSPSLDMLYNIEGIFFDIDKNIVEKDLRL